jgi:MYXO-CTERM domain-containing protein
MKLFLTVLATLVTAFIFSEARADSTCEAGKSDETRIAAHLERVEQVLRNRNVGHLSETQRDSRERHLDALLAYIARRQFPMNDRFPGKRVPFFVDVWGVHCAVAHLMAADGQSALVAEIVRRFNNAYLPAIDVPGLTEWISASGLAADELALIQPDYCGACFDDDPYDCTTKVCTPNDPNASNSCVTAKAAEGSPCGSPDDACLQPGTCNGYSCDQDPVVCDDGDPTTEDTCDSVVGCIFTPINDQTGDGGCALADHDGEAPWPMLALAALLLARRQRRRGQLSRS